MPTSRLARLRTQLEQAGLDALIVQRVVNIRYLTGLAHVFDGNFSGMLVVTATKPLLFTDFRYEQQVAASASGTPLEVESVRGDVVKALAARLRVLGAERAAIEDSVSVAVRARLENEYGRPLEVTSGMVEGLRAIKEPTEVETIARAAGLADEALGAVLGSVGAGASTRQIALDIEWYMRTHGAQAAAFDLIVAAGVRSAMPHAHTTEQTIAPGDFVKIDIGAVIDDYHSDMTRTVVAGEPNQRQGEMYEAVRQAQSLALQEIKVGRRGKAIDAVARNYLTSVGLGKNFGHGLGHGVGLEVHERPTMNQLSTDTLTAGHVVTVEPGVYIPGFGGVRIEDLVVVTNEGARNLTSSPRDLVVV